MMNKAARCFGVTLLTLLSCLHISVPTAMGASIPIIVDRVIPDSKTLMAVSFGVPFPQGTLPLNLLDKVRLVDEQGNVVVHQQNMTATWDPAGRKGVRWLLVDFIPEPGHQYWLKTGSDAPAKNATLPDVAKQTGNMIAINNGPITESFSTKGFDVFTKLNSMNSPLGLASNAAEDDRFSAYYVEHETKGIFRSDLDPDATVVLEENGPIRATIKADGWYTNAKGEKFCKYSIRMSFFRGRTEIKIEHTFIYTGLSKDDKIRSVGMRLVRSTPDVGGKQRLYVGGDDLKAGLMAKDSTGYINVAQINSERDRFDFISRNIKDDVVKESNKGGGWLYGGGELGFNVAIRDAWQQYPWGMRFDKGLLDVQLWSPEGGKLDTTWDGYWSDLTDRQKRFLAGNMQHKEKDIDAWMDRLRKACNGTGAAKTHEIWLACFGRSYAVYGPKFPYMAALAREAAYPDIAYADPKWTCATQALDWQPHAPKDTVNYPMEEGVLDAMLTMMEESVASNNMYGWWDWGGYHQHLNHGLNLPREGTWADDAGQEVWHRARPKSHYHWGRFPWLQYMRSGNRDWLRYAQRFTLYSADRAHSHFQGNGRSNGSEYHYDNSVVPWMGGYRFQPGGDQIASNLQTKDDYVYAYWLTGSRHALDVLKANGELLIANHQKGGSWSNYPPGFNRGNDIRNAGMQLERIMMLYQATWDERYLPIAKRLGNAFLPLTTADKVAKAELNPPEAVFHQAASWAYQGMWFYDRVVEDPAFRKALMGFILRARDYNPMYAYSGNTRAFTYGYLLTKDPLYLDMSRSAWDYQVANSVTKDNFTPGGKQGLSPMPGLLGLFQSAPQEWQEKNLPLSKKGVTISWRYAYWNASAVHQGTRAYFHKETDKPWGFTLLTSHGGTFAVYNPKGQIVATRVLDPVSLKWTRFELPADDMTGDYTIMCVAPSESILKTVRAEQQPEARVIACELPMVVDTLDSKQFALLSAPSLYFKVDPKPTDSNVFFGPLDTRRIVILESETSANGEKATWMASTDGKMPLQGGYYVLNIPISQAGKLIHFTFKAEPDQYYAENQCYPGAMRFNGILPYVAGNATDYFVPQLPVNYDEYKPAS